MRRALTERHNAPGENAGAAAATATIPPPAAPSRAEVTRVLATAPPIRRTDGGGSSALMAAAPTAAPRGRSRAALWFGATASALIVATIVAVAVTGTPTASGRRATPSGVQPRAGRQRAHRHRRVTRRAHSAARSPARGTRPDASVSCRGRTGLADRGIRGGGDSVVSSPLSRRRPSWRHPPSPGRSSILAQRSSWWWRPGRTRSPTWRDRDATAAAALLQAAGFAPSLRYRDAPSETLPGTILGTSPRGNPACHRNGDHRLRSGATDSDASPESHSRRPDTHHHPDTGRRGKSRCRSVRRSTVVLRPADAACSSSPRTVAEAVNPDPGQPAHTRRTPMAVSSRGEESA